jgi:hypothetical protein
MSEGRKLLDGGHPRLGQLRELEPGHGERQVRLGLADVYDDGGRADDKVVQVVQQLEKKHFRWQRCFMSMDYICIVCAINFNEK